MKVEKYFVGALLLVFFLAGAVLPNASPAHYWGDNTINLENSSEKQTSKNQIKSFSSAPGDPVDLDAAQLGGAHYLRKMQADITEDNASNGNPDIPDDPDDGGWDWVSTTFSHSTGASPTNIYGATVMGVYYTYLKTGDPTLFIVLLDAANHIVSTGPSINRSGSDMKFLMFFNALYSAEVSPTTVYSDAARSKYDQRLIDHGGTATSFAEYIRDVRGITQNYPNGIIGWDIGIYSVVAQMLFDLYGGSYATDADDIAEVIWQDSFNSNPGLFDVIADAGFDPTWADRNFWWYTLGITGLIDAFSASGNHTAEIPGLVARLLASQYSGGGISGSYGANPNDEDWQSTGYSMMSLGNLNQATYQDDINKMGYWLGATQDVSGAWIYGSGNHYPEVGGECVAGLSFTNSDNTDVLVSASFTSQADVDVYNSANSTSYVWGFNAFATIQAAINAVNGSTVTILNGSYLENIVINVPLTLTGESESGVIINIPPAGSYGILVTSGDVLMENFTLATNASNENFPIHASGTSNPPSGFSNLTLQNITITNAHRRTGFDIHGYNNLLLTNLTSVDAWGGNGLQITGCVDVTIDNITTSGNVWGSLAIYSSGPSYLNRGSDNVNIDGNTLSLAEGVLFNQNEFGLTNTNITVTGYEYMVRNLFFRPDAAGFYFYEDTFVEAVAFALGLEGIAVGSSIGSLIDNNFYVEPGLTVKAAVDEASSGDVVNIAAGTYVEAAQIVVDKDLTILGAGMGMTTIQPGFNTTVGFYLVSDALIYVDYGATVTFEDLAIDGTGFIVRHGIQSRGAGLNVRNCDIRNIYGNIYAGRGIVILTGTGLVENCIMSNIQRIGIHIRGNIEPTAPNVDVIGLTYVGKGVGDFLDYGVEFGGGGTGTVQYSSITNCLGVASSDGSTSAGILATDFFGTGTVATITYSTLSNNTTGIYAGYTPGDGTVVVANNNNISGNGTGIFSVTASDVDAVNNWWGAYDGPLDTDGSSEAIIGGTCYAVADITNQVAEGYPGDGLGDPVSSGVSYCPWVSTDMLMSPDNIVYLCSGSFDVDVSLSPSISNMKSISIRLKYPADLVFGTLTLADVNFASAPVFTWDNVSGYDSVQIDMFVQSGFIDGYEDLFTVNFSGTADICAGDMISMTRAVWKAGLSNDEIVAVVSTPLTVSADCSDPVVTINSPVDGGFYNSTPILNISTSDNCDIDFLYYQVDSDGWVAILSNYAGNSYSNSSWQLTTLEFDNLTEASHCIQFKVVDDFAREGLSAFWCFTKDVTAPNAPTDFIAEPGHNKVKLSWTNSVSPDAIGVQVQRTSWGDYPTFDTPAPAYPSAYNNGTSIFGGAVSSTIDLSGLNNTTRDIYYYGVFAYDAAGNYSAAAPSAQARSTSYWLGDVSDNIFTLGNYDGFVHVGDLTVFASSYWKTTGDGGFIDEADFGPTVGGTDNGVPNAARGIPVPDDSIQFTDLGIFAINYQVVDNVMKAVPLFTDKSINGPLSLSLEPTIDENIITLNLDLNNNNEAAKVIHITLEYSENLIFKNYENKVGDQIGSYPIFSKVRNIGNRIDFDMALLGEGASISGSGTLASFKFELNGNSAVNFDLVEGFIFDENMEDLSPELISSKVGIVPDNYVLAQNYPNPFNPMTEISYQLPKAGKVTLEIFNMLGQKVITLVDAQQSANKYQVTWNGQTDSGIKVASGTYFYRLTVNNFVQTRKMIMLK